MAGAGSRPRRPADALAGRRIALRPMAEADIPAVEPWYGEAVAAVHAAPEEPESIQNLYYQLEEAQADPDGGLLVIA